MCICIVFFIVLIVNSLASSHQQDHTPDKAIDDKAETCYQSEEVKSSWWEVDLGSEQFIREIHIKTKVEKWQASTHNIIYTILHTQHSHTLLHYTQHACTPYTTHIFRTTHARTHAHTQTHT